MRMLWGGLPQKLKALNNCWDNSSPRLKLPRFVLAVSYGLHRAQKLDWTGVSGHPGEVISTRSQKVEHLAKDVDASRLRFHEEPSFDPIPFLDYQNREYFSRPLDHAVTLDPADESIPKVKVRCSKQAKMDLFKALDASNRLVLLPARLVRRGFECGCFAIPKDTERDRMILDARPANRCEEAETRWIKSLGSLSQMHHIFLEPGKQLIVHTEDLREYYHAFVIPHQRQVRNAFKAVFRPHELRHLKCYKKELDAEDWVVPALGTMAMGDLNSVAFGQTAHLSVILRNSDLELSDFLTLQGRPQRGDMHAGLLIDDFVLWEQVELDADLEQPTPGSKIVEQVRAAYLKVGLPRHPGKAVSKSPVGEFWGAELDGVRGWIRPNLKRLIPLAHILCRVVRCGRCSVALLEILTGSLVSAFQLRRRLMSMLHELYAAQKGRERTDVVSLSKELKDEMLMCAGLLALCVMDLRLEASPLLLASDASSHTRAATATEVGSEATKELQKFGLQKGLWNRLLSPEKVVLRHHGLLEEEAELPGDGEHYESHPLWQEICCSQQFHQFGRIRRQHKKHHINVSEVQAALEAEEEHGRMHPGSYYVHLVDSQVAAACLTKGRSSSWQLNRLLRQSIVPHLVHGCKPFYGYIRSQYNPGDDPTRGVEVRAPAHCEASWLTRLKAGDPTEMDEFLKEAGLGLRQMAGLPDPNELMPDAPYDYRDAKAVRRDRGRQFKKNQKKEFDRQLASECKAENTDEAQTTERRSPTPEKSLFQVGGSSSSRSSADTPLEIVSRQTGYNEEVLLRLFRKSQFVFSSQFPDLETALKSGPGLLDLFSGARGFAKSFSRTATSWAICFDLKHHASENLLDADLQELLLQLISKGFFLAMSCSPVCASFSTAITPPWRTLAYPAGRPDLTAEQHAKVEIGQAQLQFTLRLVRACLQHRLVFWVENPATSWFWKQEKSLSCEKILEEPEVDFLIVDQCRFGTPWRKKTKFLTNSHLAGQRAGCQCQRPHTILRGRCKVRKMNFTKLAEAYPRALCSVLGSAVAIDVGALGERRRLDIGACAKAATLRIGEALHPGPRKKRQQRTVDLEEFELLEPQTVAMRQRFWLDFTEWIEKHLGPGSLHWCLAAPILLVKILEAYGYEQFRAGFPLHYYRQLAAHVQREFPLVRPYISIAWSVVSKWEHFEPVQHRTPMPEPLLRAMCSLALLWKWKRVAAILLLTFYSVSRVGEVLRAAREDLLTPDDLLSERMTLFLKIRLPKSRGRGPKTQYSSCDEAEVVSFISAVYKHVPATEALYPSAASAFRRRFDALLDFLQIHKKHRITPGSLRGGGAVWGHRQHIAIDELCWKMRLQHTKTLRYYLQEVAADSILPSLEEDSRKLILLLQGLLPPLLLEFASD